jgi:uncharacterized membrane-anchored protein
MVKLIKAQTPEALETAINDHVSEVNKDRVDRGIYQLQVLNLIIMPAMDRLNNPVLYCYVILGS